MTTTTNNPSGGFQTPVMKMPLANNQGKLITQKYRASNNNMVIKICGDKNISINLKYKDALKLKQRINTETGREDYVSVLITSYDTEKNSQNGFKGLNTAKIFQFARIAYSINKLMIIQTVTEFIIIDNENFKENGNGLNTGVTLTFDQFNKIVDLVDFEATNLESIGYSSEKVENDVQ